jgi:hypothetical protein
MNRINRTLAGSVVILLLLLCASVYSQLVIKKDKDGFLEGRNYKEGTAWVVTFIKHKAGQDIFYLNALADVWRKQQEALKKEGVILSYKVLQTNATRLEDYNVMLLVEYKDIKSLEANADKQAVILQKIAQENPDSWKVLNDDKVYEYFGSNVSKEIIFKTSD